VFYHLKTQDGTRGSAVSFTVMPGCEWARYDVSLGKGWVISNVLL